MRPAVRDDLRWLHFLRKRRTWRNDRTSLDGDGKQCDQMVEIKNCPILPKVAISVFKSAQKVGKYYSYFWTISWEQDHSKISHSGHTDGKASARIRLTLKLKQCLYDSIQSQSGNDHTIVLSRPSSSQLLHWRKTILYCQIRIMFPNVIKLWSTRQTRIASKVGLHLRRIAPKNIIYV